MESTWFEHLMIIQKHTCLHTSSTRQEKQDMIITYMKGSSWCLDCLNDKLFCTWITQINIAQDSELIHEHSNSGMQASLMLIEKEQSW